MAETNGLHLAGEQELDTLSREGLQTAIADYNKDIQRFDVSPTNSQLLGWFTVSCCIINRSIGGAIFAAPPIILRGTGSVGGALMVWFAGGIIALCGLMCWLELGLTIPFHNVCEEDRLKNVSTPRSGGEKNYLEYIYGKPAFFMTCVYGLMFIVFGNLAANAVAFGIYVMTAADADSNNRGPVTGLAIGVLTLCAVINAFSREGFIWINNALAFGKIALLIVITILGFVHAGGKLQASVNDNSSVAANNAASDNFNPGKSFLVQPKAASDAFVDVIHSIFYVISPFAGFKQPFYVLGEVSRPRQLFPKVTISTVVIIWVLYMVVNISYLCVVPHEIYTSTRTNAIDIASTFFTDLFNPGRGSNTIERVMAAVIALSIFGNLMVHTFTAGRIKQEIAKEGIIPFSLFFVTGHDTPGAKLLAFLRHNTRPRAIVDMENHLEQTPTSAIWLHWMTAVILVAVTAILLPNEQYSFLVYLYAYTNHAVIGTLVAGGLLYLKLGSLNGKRRHEWANKVAWKPWLDPLHAVIYFSVMAFLAFASFAPPSATSPFDQSVTGYAWWVVPVIGLSSLLFGVVWWCGLQIMQWKGRWRLRVSRKPYIVKDEDGTYVQKVELVDHDRRVNVAVPRKRRNHDDGLVEIS